MSRDKNSVVWVDKKEEIDLFGNAWHIESQYAMKKHLVHEEEYKDIQSWFGFEDFSDYIDTLSLEQERIFERRTY